MKISNGFKMFQPWANEVVKGNLNYLIRNQYDGGLSYWFIYNKQPDKLHGTKWESGVIWAWPRVYHRSQKSPAER